MEADRKKFGDRLRSYYQANREYIWIGVGILGLLVVLLAVWTSYDWGSGASAPKSTSRTSTSDQGGDAVLGLAGIIACFFLARAMLRGTLQIYGTIAYFGLFAVIAVLIFLLPRTELPEKRYLAAAAVVAVVLGAFMEIGNRIAFRLSEINKSLGELKDAVQKQAPNRSQD